MHTGHYISGSGHLLLLAWLAFGDVFAAEPLPFEMTEVSVISGAEYAALVAAGQSPESVTEIAQPSSPEITQDAPEVDVAPDTETETTPPEAAQTPDVETPPDVSQITPLPPRAEVSDAAPVLPQPPADVAVDVPDVADQAVPQAVDRVAPEAVAQPDPEALPDPVEQDAVSQEETGTQEQDPALATAPEAAATEIVTEADEPARTLNSSPRPPTRPTPPQTAAATAPEAPAAPPEAPTTQDTPRDALADALAEASSAPAVPSGPPLSAGEKEALRVAVSSCWNVGSLSTDALGTTVVVTVSMAQDGKPVTGSIRMASSSGGNDTAARQAFEAARRAIIRCGARGFDLPAEKYGQWQEIEMTFNPERMRVK
ncbi:energy transducer TonB [uncultured Roseobacter sp.]|uniref:energy transducer TonB n=1 Tax=uncultured Roseobacter sp. TaxID=114847 RepID=UPI002627C6A7|nr:energy transducer TonB [uncultured Roseobacter sp.]